MRFAKVLKAHTKSNVHGPAQIKAWLSRARHIVGSSKEGWTYADGSTISEKDYARLMLKPPAPGWTNILFNPDPKSDLISEGTAKNGKQQKRYTPTHTSKSEVHVFQRVEAFLPFVDGVIDRTHSGMNDPTVRPKMQSKNAVIYTIMRTALRVGNEKELNAKVKAYGVTTLEGKHVTVDGDDVTFDFPGKAGVQNKKTVTDPELAKYMAKRLNVIGADERIFSTTDRTANFYLKALTGADFTAKDLRTWNGTALARYQVDKEPMPKNEAELADQKKRISAIVGAHLLNSPAIALQKYIDPSVFRMMSDPKEISATAAKPKTKAKATA